MIKINLFVDDHTLKRNITEFKDLYVKTHDVVGWECPFATFDEIEEKSGYCLSFSHGEESNDGFSLEMSYEGAEHLYRILRDVVNKERKLK